MAGGGDDRPFSAGPGKPVGLTSVFPLVLCLTGCDLLPAPRLDEANRRAAALCENWPGGGAIDASRAGDISAVDCLIARRTSSSVQDRDSDYPEAWLELGYLRWRISGERSQIALEAASQMTRHDVLGVTALMESYMRFTPDPDLNERGCWIVNPVQIELMMAAEADRTTAECMDNYFAQAEASGG